MDYLWEEDETAKGEYIPNYRCAPLLPCVEFELSVWRGQMDTDSKWNYYPIRDLTGDSGVNRACRSRLFRAIFVVANL